MNHDPAAGTELLPLHSGEPPVEPRGARPKLSFEKLSFKLLFPWICTAVFLVFLIITVRVYEQKDVITSSQKNNFNLISTALIVFLTPSFYEAFKGLATAIQPRLVHWFNLPSDIEHKVEGFENLLVVSSLLFHRVSRGFWFFCLIWIIFNLMAQLAAAVISITYSIDDGKDYNGTYLRNGSVRVTDLSCYLHDHDKECPNQVIQDQLAHAYGDNTQGPDSVSPLECGEYSDVESVIKSKQNFPYYCRRNTTIQEFAYRFNEYNPNDTQEAYPYFTDRVVTASSGVCNEYTETGNQAGVVGDDKTYPPNAISALNITYTNGTYNGSIFIPTSALGREGTTYIYRGPAVPSAATTYGFGRRGLIMWVYRNPGTQSSRFFECPVTVSNVTHVQNPAHDISDATAREAVASIALQGQFRGTRNNVDFTQWQWYASGHPWEVHHQNQSRVGANVAEHTIVSLMQMVNRNPTIQIPGMVPHLGSKLSVRWKYFEALLASLFAVDTLLVILSFSISRLESRG